MKNDRRVSLTSFPRQSNRRAFLVLLTLAVLLNSADATRLVDRRLEVRNPGASSRSKRSSPSDMTADETIVPSGVLKQVDRLFIHDESKNLWDEGESSQSREPPPSPSIKSLEEKRPGESQAGFEKRMGKSPMLHEESDTSIPAVERVAIGNNNIRPHGMTSESDTSIPAVERLVIGNNNIKPDGTTHDGIPNKPLLTGVKSDASSEQGAFGDSGNTNGESSIVSEVKPPAGSESANQQTVKKYPEYVALNTANKKAARLDIASLGLLGVGALGVTAASVLNGMALANQQASPNNTMTPAASPTQLQNYRNDQFIPSSFSGVTPSTQPPSPDPMFPLPTTPFPQSGFRALRAAHRPRNLRCLAASCP
uniref:AlNc14C73G4994 protein n=1 Tax=Albugo laibachii Nc14 TaxID=890382 RepID=F0WED7_9STRA|nr:AlNc14C73G4994 [Albugo laibachii Nc14]|eukprot:CCA19569.1 AlNc14C73G4994 [Albugo laibachii Nc14]